jgi:hypothetical protein
MVTDLISTDADYFYGNLSNENLEPGDDDDDDAAADDNCNDPPEKKVKPSNTAAAAMALLPSINAHEAADFVGSLNNEQQNKMLFATVGREGTERF